MNKKLLKDKKLNQTVPKEYLTDFEFTISYLRGYSDGIDYALQKIIEDD